MPNYFTNFNIYDITMVIVEQPLPGFTWVCLRFYNNNKTFLNKFKPCLC